MTEEQVKCNCEYGTIPESIKELIEKDAHGNEEEIARLSDLYKRRDPDTRSSHFSGCPIDVTKYAPGEFYCHTVKTHANAFLIPRSKGLLELGPLNEESDDYEIFRKEGGMTGVYRKKE